MTSQPCALWWKDLRNITMFEVLNTYEDAVRQAAAVRQSGWTVLGIELSDGTKVDAASIPAPPPIDRESRERDGERLPTTERQMIEITDPFTNTRIKVWEAPEWMKQRSAR